MININVKDREGRNVTRSKRPIGDKLMEVLREYDWGVAAICGGMCSCGTCHVYLGQDGWINFRSPMWMRKTWSTCWNTAVPIRA